MGKRQRVDGFPARVTCSGCGGWMRRLVVGKGARAHGRNVDGHCRRGDFGVSGPDGVEDGGVLGHGLFDVDRAVVHGLAKSVNVHGGFFAWLKSRIVVPLAARSA